MRHLINVSGVFIAIVAAAGMLMAPSPTQACTTAKLAGSSGPMMVKSYDWHDESGAVNINPRGVIREAFTLWPAQVGASWTARYGSVTFNQYGRGFPNGGLNEAGLAVEVLWLRQSQSEAVDARATLNELQWIQWALDRFDSVADLVAHAGDHRIARIAGPVHYFACDAKGECATFELIKGALVVHSGADLVVPTLTNHTYARSMKALSAQHGGAPSGTGSLQRFMRAAHRTRANSPTMRDAWALLDDVSTGDYTKWTIVYELAARRISYRTHRRSGVKTVDFKDLDFSCSAPPLSVSLDTKGAGAITQWLHPWDAKAQRPRLKKSLGTMDIPFPSVLAGRLTAWPESDRCPILPQTP